MQVEQMFGKHTHLINYGSRRVRVQRSEVLRVHPSAIGESLTDRTPGVITDTHQWNQAGQLIKHEEYGDGDKRRGK